MKYSPENMWILPVKRTYQAPICYYNRGELWFDKKEPTPNFDTNCKRALIAKGIGNCQCPTMGEWVAFCLVGGIIAALTGKYITPPKPLPFAWEGNMDLHIWEALWQVQ